MINIARYYSETWRIEDQKAKPAIKSGSKGLRSHVRGWDIGVEVSIFTNEDGEDEIIVRPTGGSNNPKPGEIVFTDSNSEEPEQFVVPMQEIRIRLPKRSKIKLDQHN